MIDKLIAMHGILEVHINNFNERFFQGADFFKKKMWGGNLSGRDFRGSDFSKSNLTNIDLSSIICGFSFVRLVMLIGCGLFSAYVAVNLSSLHDSVMGTELDSQEIDSIIENLSFKTLFLLSFAFSIYYAVVSSYLYKIFESKAVACGIEIEESFINSSMKTMTVFLKIIYVQCFGTAISATAILLLGNDKTTNILGLLLFPIDDYHQEVAFYLLLFKTLNLGSSLLSMLDR
jgi:Pentapeptide repeats (8 copies)